MDNKQKIQIVSDLTNEIYTGHGDLLEDKLERRAELLDDLGEATQAKLDCQFARVVRSRRATDRHASFSKTEESRACAIDIPALVKKQGFGNWLPIPLDCD